MEDRSAGLPSPKGTGLDPFRSGPNPVRSTPGSSGGWLYPTHGVAPTSSVLRSSDPSFWPARIRATCRKSAAYYGLDRRRTQFETSTTKIVTDGCGTASSPAVFERKQTEALSAHNDNRGSGESMRIRGIATFRNFARNLSPLVMWQPFQHPLSSSRRGQLGLGRQHRLLGGWLSLYWTNQRQLH
jgi:hypothetical protein